MKRIAQFYKVSIDRFIEAMKEEFDKTATHKIRRFKYKEGAQKTGEGASQDSENKPEDKASSQK